MKNVRLLVKILILFFSANQYKYGILAQEAKSVPCTRDNSKLHSELLEIAGCSPKEVLVPLQPNVAHERVTPSAVMVKQCVGTCDYDAHGTQCYPIRTVKKYIPTRVYNLKTNKEPCSMHVVEEHTVCGCCTGVSEGACQQVHVPDTSLISSVKPIACTQSHECRVYCLNRCRVRVRQYTALPGCIDNQCTCTLVDLPFEIDAALKFVGCTNNRECLLYCKARCNRRAHETTTAICRGAQPGVVGSCDCRIEDAEYKI